ncbi:tripartite tricarboxylate transporter substrate binding protein [soil metagenome]
MRRRIAAAAALIALSAGVSITHAQTNAPAPWPTKPVRLIVPFAAGGATDVLARQLAQKLESMWGHQVLIDNKAGAGTVIGTDAVAKAAPDGYTLGMVISAHVINPSLRPNLPYDTINDLVPVSQVGSQDMVIAANPSFPVNTVPELIAYAKANPGVQYASPGSGTAMHLAMEMLKLGAGVELVHVPYRGGAPAQQDVMGGQLPLLVDVYYSASPQIKGGKLKAIALLSPKRAPSAPQIPLVAETYPNVSTMSFAGVVAPKGTPPALVEKISSDIAKAVKSSDFGLLLQQSGLEPVGSTPAQFGAFIKTEIAKWTPVVKASGAKAD